MDKYDILRSLPSLPLFKARDFAIAILREIPVPPMTDSSESAIQKRARVNKLVRDIENANSPFSIGQTMWNLDQAKAGLNVANSAWDKHYKSI
jgi:hypothetical protein